jgi:hypothetical protein
MVTKISHFGKNRLCLFYTRRPNKATNKKTVPRVPNIIPKISPVELYGPTIIFPVVVFVFTISSVKQLAFRNWAKGRYPEYPVSVLNIFVPPTPPSAYDDPLELLTNTIPGARFSPTVGEKNVTPKLRVSHGPLEPIGCGPFEMVSNPILNMKDAGRGTGSSLQSIVRVKEIPDLQTPLSSHLKFTPHTGDGSGLQIILKVFSIEKTTDPLVTFPPDTIAWYIVK